MRVDASTAMGTGHLRRCLALGRALLGMGSSVVLVSRDLGLDWRALARDAGVEATRSLPAPGTADLDAARRGAAPHAGWAEVTQERDAAETCAALGGDAPDWIVVDSYSFDSRWHDEVRRATGARLCVIDDLADRPLSADLLVDHNLSPDHRAKYGEHGSGVRRLLGGPRFALLDRCYQQVHAFRVRDRVESIGIFVGGTDPWNASAAAALACLDGAGFGGSIEIASTRSNPHLASLRSLARERPSVSLLVDAPDLSAFFSRHDLQIGAGGGAALERCRVGAPSILVALAGNQVAPVGALVACGAARQASSVEAGSMTPVLQELLADPAARRELSRRARAVVDGRGTERVALALLADETRLRPARPEDAEPAWRWRNEPTTRRHFRDASEIGLEAHLLWWQECLADERRRLLMGCCGGIDVGVLRLDLDDGEAEVALYLDPGLHGLGLGTALLRAGQAWVRRREPSVARLLADILPGNEASAAAFAAAGFGRADERTRVWEVVPA